MAVGKAACNRRGFLVRGAAAFGFGALGCSSWSELVKHPLAGKTLPKWQKGRFRISVLFNGCGETSFLVFPDGTSLLIDCGDYVFGGRDVVKHLPDDSRRAGEWTARYILRENPNGKKVDYFLLTHYHSDHSGSGQFSAGRGANGKYSISGIGQAMDHLDFGTFIDRSWPDVNDPAPRKDSFDDWTVKHVKEIYTEAERRGIKVERFRLAKGSDQIRQLHGGGGAFAFVPLCSNGCILQNDGTVQDLGKLAGPDGRRTGFDENALSIGFILSLGDFRYFTAGDFSGHVKRPDGTRADIEVELAKVCPRVDIVKANHHGHHTMPDSLVAALRARVIVAGIWHLQHMNRPTMRRFAKADWPCLYAPGLFPKARRDADAAEPWFKDFAPECFEGAHAVIDVAPDGKTYRLMMVSAADENGTILGAYDFTTTPKPPCLFP
ncbi:MAG: MBL fold metallo-hydrolase [Kiritimatiellae bacterium]|nr:MBL fold metallo-hydrolase [Kiritimatiellia bacterium]